jgi:hypothetical protein
MTYRIVEGELYHVVEAAVCHFQNQTCTFYNCGNASPCDRAINPHTQTRPCMQNGQSIIFLRDEQMLGLLSLRLTQ